MAVLLDRETRGYGMLRGLFFSPYGAWARRTNQMLPGICARWKDRLRFGIAALIVLAMLYPTIWMCLSALKSNRQIFRDPFGLPQHWLWSNIPKAWHERELARLYLNSVIVTVVAMALTVFAATAAAFAVARLEFPGLKRFTVCF